MENWGTEEELYNYLAPIDDMGRSRFDAQWEEIKIY